MVAGKVKAAMGLQKTPPSRPREEQPSPKHYSASPSSEKPPSSSHKTIFSRSFGVYFPRSSSQVQPRPPDVAELLRLVDDLENREARLKTEILQHKLLKETAAVVPFLETEIRCKDAAIEHAARRIEILEAENEGLNREVEGLKVTVERQAAEGERKMKEVEDEIAKLQKALERKEAESSKEADEIASAEMAQGSICSSARSNLAKIVKNDSRSSNAGSTRYDQKLEISDLNGDDADGDDEDDKLEMQKPDRNEEIARSSAISSSRLRAPRIPRPPPRPSSSSSSVASVSDASVARCSAPVPPPPPPPPARLSSGGAAKVRRVPEVAELYHSLMRRESKRDASGAASEVPAAANARDMIGEIENRSSHLLAIKTDVETQGDFIRFLIKEVQNAEFTDIEDVVAFVKWLDDELSFLVDERAVLKQFDWPEHKADAMREAAFGYSDLKKLESEVSSFADTIRQPYSSALKKMQAFMEKLEHRVYNLTRTRDDAIKRYKSFQIPWEWMLDSGCITQIKLASVKLAMKHMKRISSELEVVVGPEAEELVFQGVRFAFRVHQFAGGFDVETMRAFHELRNKSHSCHTHSQNQQQPKLLCRSTSC